MKTQIQNDYEQMRSYLLGLDTAATEDFESRVFADDALYLALQEERDALIDDFLSGQLSADEARRFRAQCELSVTLRHKVAELRDLRTALEERRAMTHSRAPARVPRWVWWLMPVAAGVCLFVFLFIRRGHETPVAQHAHLTTQEAKPDVPAQAAAVFFIPYGTVRGSVEMPVLNIPRSASAVDLQLELSKTVTVGSHWKIELVRGGDAPLLAIETPAQQIGTETFVVAHVTATSLPDGSYTARLTPTDSDQHALKSPFLVKHIRGS